VDELSITDKKNDRLNLVALLFHRSLAGNYYDQKTLLNNPGCAFDAEAAMKIFGKSE
jgi:hypothetical protein